MTRGALDRVVDEGGLVAFGLVKGQGEKRFVVKASPDSR